MAYTITINGVDRSKCIINRSISITDEAKDKPSTLRCRFFNHDSGTVPEADDEIIITKDSVKLFAGNILQIDYTHIGDGENDLILVCTDYTRVMDRNLVVEGYENMTDKQIIESIINNYCQGIGIDTSLVETGVTISKITFNYLQPSQCFRKLCELTGRTWYLDYDKYLHYHVLETNVTPFDIDSSNADYRNLKITKDNTDIRNRVYVRGSTYLSDPTTISQVADGEQTVFILPNKPHDFSMTEGGVAKTVGIKNIDSPDSFDYLMNFQEKYIEKANGTPPAADTVMSFTFKYEIPILVAVEDRDSIEDVGQYEFAIFDNNIKTQDDARSRAQAEIADYADTIIDGTFETTVDGFKAGQYININVTDFGINDNYLVQKVTGKSLGGGNFVYIVSVASTKKLGIITFLIKMLENDKNFLEIDPNEVVDELFTPDSQGILVSDSIVSDSLIEPPFKWGSCKWGLAQWS